MKRIGTIFCTLAIILLFSACSKSSTDYSGQTLTGKVTDIDGTKITVQLGELSEQEMSAPGGMQQPGEAPLEMSDGDSQEKQGDNETLPEKPDGNDETLPEKPDSNGETPPDKPDGNDETLSDKPDSNSETPPEKPDGDGGSSDSTEPEMPSGSMTLLDGNMEMNRFTAGDETVTLDFDGAKIKVEAGMETNDGSLEDIAEDAILVIEIGEKNQVETVTVKFTGGMEMLNGGQPGDFGGSGEVTQGTAAATIDTDGEYKDMEYTSTGDDENALRVDSAAVTLDGITVDKSSGASSNTEDGDFYGMNAALLATNGATVTIKNAVITSSAQNGNGVFSYGSGTTVNISDSKITTNADNSGGIQTTGGGTTNAENLTIETSGSSAAAIRSDRGGGTVNVDGGSYTTNGYNSPSVYSTAVITVKNAVLTANNSEALVIEGKNSIALENCDVAGNMSDTEGTSSDENVHNVMIYQSMSGDADVGTSSFSMTGGTLTSNNGDMFYITNTHCILKLSGVELINKETDGYLLKVAGNSASRGWGTAGANGGQVEMTASAQILEGNIAVDSISTLNLTFTGGSEFTGTINIIDNEEGGTAVSDNAVVTVEEGCVWTLTGDCTLTSLENNGTIHFNGYTITLSDGTVLK